MAMLTYKSSVSNGEEFKLKNSFSLSINTDMDCFLSYLGEIKLKDAFLLPISGVVVSWSGSSFSPDTMESKILAEILSSFLPDIKQLTAD